MLESRTTKRLPTNLAEHQAVRAWRQLQPERPEPEGVEVVKLKHKTAVYRLSGAGRDGEAVVAKRCRATTAPVERLVYEKLLPTLAAPGLEYFGWVPEAEGEFCWLFLEDAGAHAYSPADEEHRALAGRWLGTLHGTPIGSELRASLPDRSPDHYSRLVYSSREALRRRVESLNLSPDESELLRKLVSQCDVMITRWRELAGFFDGWPRALIHGDFVIKNLRLRAGTSGPELLVFDWEMAGWGVPAVDLAQAVGKTASPNLVAYQSVMSQRYPRLKLVDIERLAAYGSVLRLVDKIFWEALTMDQDIYEFLVRPISTLKGYEPQLALALRAINWEPHD